MKTDIDLPTQTFLSFKSNMAILITKNIVKAKKYSKTKTVNKSLQSGQIWIRSNKILEISDLPNVEHICMVPLSSSYQDLTAP